MPANGISPLIPTLFLSLIFPYSSAAPTAPSGRFIVGLVPTEEIRKRCQEYKKGLYKLDIHNGVITHLEPVILECEVQWVIGSITRRKVMEVMDFLLKYFKS